MHPFADDQRQLSAYLERLLVRPAVKRVITEAQPYFWMFPYLDAMPKRYQEAF